MGKKFLGLGGTDHFWDRAKAWILNQITSAVAAKIAEIVANAPEDLDTLKEIADWISAHANDAAAMNTQITENKNNIAANTSDISALKTSVAGKADKLHTHSAGDIASGTLPIANGGTGATTAKDGFMNLANGLTRSQNPQDTEYMIYKASGNWGLYTLQQFCDYIKSKIPRIKYADYQTPTQTFTQFQQVPIELSKFSSEVTPNNVLCFMVIYWTGVQLIASGDWGSAASSGLKCALISLGAGTGWGIIRCVYMV